MGWQLRVYNPANTTLQGTLTEAYGVSATFRLGTLGVLSFNVDMESSADLALLEHMRVVRIYDDVLEQELPEAFLVHDIPAASTGDVEPEPDSPSSVTFQCPTLGAWLGTSQKGGAVLYPRRGLTGRKRDPRAFGWQAADYDDSAWATSVSLGSQDDPDVSSLSGFPAGWLEPSAEWIWSRALDDGVHPAGTSYFRTTLNHEGLVRVSFTANTSGVLWIDEDKALETNPDDRFAFKEFLYVDFDLDGETVFAVKATNRGGPAGIILSVVAIDDDGEPTGDPLLITDNTWLTLDYPAMVPGVTPGFLMDTVLDEAQTRGAIPHLSWTFTGLVDSGNDAWSKEIAHQFRVGSKLGWIDEQVTQWAADSYVTETGVYRLVNLRGADLTATVSLHTLEDVRFQGEAPVANALLYLSSDDMAETDVVSALDRIEEAVTFGTSDEVEALEEMAGLLLAELAEGHDAASLALSDAGGQPVSDFWIGDVVTHPGRDGSTTGRVTELVGTLDDGGVDWQVVCEFEDGGFTRTRARRLQEQLRETFDQTAGGRARLSHPKAGPSVGVPGGGKKGGGGGGFPATITVETFGQEIPHGEWTALDWVADVRNNLMSFAGTEVRLPVAGTWHVHDVEVSWAEVTFDSEWKGGGVRLRTSVDGVQRWPAGLEEWSTPDRGLPVPSVKVASVPTEAVDAGLLVLEVLQSSGESQTVDRGRMSVSLREPRSTEQPSLSLGDPVLATAPDIVAQDVTIWPRDGQPDVLLTVTGSGIGEVRREAYNAENFVLYGTVNNESGGSSSKDPMRGIDYTPGAAAVDGYRLLINGRTSTGSIERWWLHEAMNSPTQSSPEVRFDYSATTTDTGGCRNPDGRVYIIYGGSSIRVFNPPHFPHDTGTNSYQEFFFDSGMMGCSWHDGLLYVAHPGTNRILRFDGETIESVDSVDVSEFLVGATGVHVESDRRWWLSSRENGVVLIDPVAAGL